MRSRIHCEAGSQEVRTGLGINCEGFTVSGSLIAGKRKFFRVKLEVKLCKPSQYQVIRALSDGLLPRHQSPKTTEREVQQAISSRRGRNVNKVGV